MKNFYSARSYLRHALRLSKPPNGPEIRVGALGLMIGYYAKIGEANKIPAILKDAHKIIRAIKSAEDKFHSLMCLADAYAHIGQTSKARQILSQAHKLAKTGSFSYRDHSLTMLAAKYAEISEYDRAFQIVEKIEGFSKEFTLEQIAGICIKNGHDKQAFRIVKIVEKNLSKKERLLNKIFGDCKRDSVLQGIAEGYAEIGKSGKAIALAKTIVDALSRAEALMVIAHKYIDDGENNRACRILSQAVQFIKTDKLGYPEILRLLNIAEEYAEAGQKGRALKIVRTFYEEIRKMESNSKSDILDRDELIARLVRVYMKCGRFQIAKKIGPKNYTRRLNYVNILNFVKVMQYEKAIKAAQKIRLPHLELWILDKIIKDFGQKLLIFKEDL